ncbi:hypothetical protein [Bdellovibrio bacteriovorus]|uniref:Uncharacterized protein n=1 Tax=Bdellovibrio bacteriovorus str. Tiberius TaxID=1069642 RepID=K7ZE72_BDEBC|nr:hypothetical protein [Bdellovibrio bacteriovorus]AFY00212.1 hypothetical protein Bdt_0504 [Bdellovibrio bacteriovorus str. Tiberius]
MKKVLMVALLMAGVQAQADTEMRVYTNAEGCSVVQETRTNGTTYDIEIAGQRAFVGILHDKSTGDIAAFCDDVQITNTAKGLKMECAKNQNGGLTTRGAAELGLLKDGTLTSISVIGQVKKLMGWQTDTEISCANLEEDIGP